MEFFEPRQLTPNEVIQEHEREIQQILDDVPIEVRASVEKKRRERLMYASST